MQKINLFPFVLLLLTYSLDLFARAGGGGGSGSSGSGSGGVAGLVTVGIVYAIYKIRRARLMIQAKRQFAAANANDSSWNLESFKETASKIFYSYQDAWMNKDLRPMEAYFHPSYFKLANEKMNRKLKGKKNILKNIDLKSVELMSVLDIEGQEGDMFVLELDFKLVDYTIDEKTGEFLSSPIYRDQSESLEDWKKKAQREQDEAIEYWVFYRYKSQWVLYNIHQVDSLFGDLKHASVGKLKKILAAEKAKPADAPVDDEMFYKKVD